MTSERRIYEVPKVTVITLVPYKCLLITSNEGLGFEDLFTSAPNAFPLNEEPFEIIP